ncbi:MAG: hypothetical protein B6U78_00140 [Candidatus Aenigmarchaeota archaeon ex4484_224]|nr:MAG: hypothetical protein B6U78_00140 [Candidatus Aenigmarchaeota archaeon ex4484_224]
MVKLKVSSQVRRKGYTIFKSNGVKIALETNERIHFNVKGENEEHFVIFDKKRKKFSCDCQFFALHEKPCSHIYAAYLFLKSSKRL